MKTVKFFTFGCKVNQYETQAIRERILSSGLEEVGADRCADLYIINSCTVTHRADSDSLSCLRRAQRENPRARVVFTGCLAELDAKKIQEHNKDIFILKNSQKESIQRYLAKFQADLLPSTPLKKGISFFERHTRAFLKIQDGCNNRCSYCKVPLVRGKSRSKPMGLIAREARQLVAGGVKEIVLCGICLGSYGNDLSPRISLVYVIKMLQEIPGLLRIRLSSIEAHDVSLPLIRLFSSAGKLCPHVHIPIQSGDTGLLKLMNRSYTHESYLGLIRKIRSRVPEIAVTTDVLVGFPGETEAAFKNTIKLVKEVVPLRVHIFPYSPRPGTAAARFGTHVPLDVTRQRVKLMREIASECALQYKRAFIGKNAVVLFEENKDGETDYWSGYTANYLRVVAHSSTDLRNSLIPVKVMGIEKEFLLARLTRK